MFGDERLLTTALGSLLFTGGTLQYSAANATDYSARFSNAGGQSWIIDTNSRDVTYAASLTGTGSSLAKLGGGILTLTGTNTFTGGTNITGGNTPGTAQDARIARRSNTCGAAK